MTETGELYTMRSGEERPLYLYQGRRVVKLDNGTLFDVDAAAFTSGGNSETQITSANARSMAARRWEKARDAAADGMTASVVDVGGKTEWDAWREIVKTQAGLAMDPTQGKVAVMAAQFVGKAAGYEREKGGDAQGDSVQLTVPVQVARRIIDELRGRVIDGTSRDV